MTEEGQHLQPARPRIRLRPNVDAARFRRGAPWAYANEIVTDRRTKALSPGSLAILEDSARTPICLVAVNPASKIFARVVDPSPDAQIDQSWFEQRIARALQLRTILFDRPYYRLAHAEADALAGVVIDRFDETLVIQPNAFWIEQRFEMLAQASLNVTGASRIIKNGSSRARQIEGLEEITEQTHGAPLSGALTVPMNGALYLADVIGGQKTGLYYDQRFNHRFAASLAKDLTVLDVFSHVGGFGLAALGAGALEVTSVDGSQAALDLAQRGAAQMGAAERYSVQKGDAFEVMSQYASDGRSFDFVICDPPAFAPSRTALGAGLRAYERVAKLAATLVKPGGYLALCSCSHAAELGKFRSASLRGITRAGRRATLLHTGFAGPDHPQLPELSESGYLKALFFRL